MRQVDVLVVGGGPAGLHAALKAAVLNHTVLLVDKGRRFSRVSQAPAIANVPGRPGISGEALLEEGRRDLARFEDQAGKRLVELLEPAEVTALEPLRAEGDASARWLARVRDAAGEREVRAGVVVLATGLVDRKPGISEYEWKGHQTLAPLLDKRLVGYCLLCEGWSLEGKRVAVFGRSEAAASIANDVCDQFGGEVALLTDGAPAPRALVPAVRVDARRIERLSDEGSLAVAFADGGVAHFDKALFGLGWHQVNSDLVRPLGARLTEEGYVVTNESREVLDARGEPIRGLFAAGDVRAGPWKQIPLAWADAELAVISAYAYRLPPATPTE
ncbi:MAG TPA: NAD(P)/FAD-dependent oxidoreductase [Candidatus Thermoplasmatota archaeon]|nr:NAD(P)/FAD-dependent oxidoreductase [Candidatus Thermoplasmatota archaeon]